MKKVNRTLLKSFLALIALLLIVSIILFIPQKVSSKPWAQTNGPYGGYIHCFAIEDKDIFVGTEGSGVFHSTDNGKSWSEINSGLTSKNVYSLAISGKKIFAGTNGGVYTSDNNGVSWNLIDSDLKNTIVLSLAASGTNIFAGTSSGVFLSTDNGANWKAVNSGLTFLSVNSLAIKDNNIFAGTEDGGIFLSTNNGESWSPVNSGLTTTQINSLLVSVQQSLQELMAEEFLFPPIMVQVGMQLIPV